MSTLSNVYKITKESITSIEPTSKPWKEVGIYLLGPVLDRKHVLVAQDIFTLFPTAKTLNSKSPEPAIKASNSAYTDFRDTKNIDQIMAPLTTHKHSIISHNPIESTTNSIPVSSTSKPAKTFMKALGKTMYYQNRNKTLALNQLLTSNWANLHPATGHKSGDLLFQHSYTNQFSPVTTPAYK